MKLTLTTDDGEVLRQWDIDEEFGDIEMPLPKQLLAAEVAEYVTTYKWQHRGNNE